MQYEKTVSELKSYQPQNTSLSLTTQAAINKILNLDALDKHGKSLVTADFGQVTAHNNSIDLTQELKQIKGEKAVMLSVGASAEPVTLTLPSTTAKTFVFDSEADLKAAFKASGSVIISGSGSDVLTISGSKNLVDAGSGNDNITTASGNDTIKGGEGKDDLKAGSGNDSVSGGNGDDKIDGGNGNDTLSGDDGNDKLYGGNGNDKLYGGNGDDTVNGDNGNDKLYGGNGDDAVNGGNGNDTLEGGAGNDSLSGGKGQDTYVWSRDAVRANESDTLTDDKGSKLVINFEGLKVDDQELSYLDKGTVHVGGTLDAHNNIAFDGNTLQIDIDGIADNSGHYTADFQIEIVGTVKGVDFNAKTDTFTLI